MDERRSYALVQKYLRNETSLEEATNSLLEPIDAANSANRLDTINLINFWRGFIQAAQSISFRDEQGHERLINLVRAIKEHPAPPDASQPDLYSSLDYFGMSCREALSDRPGGGVVGYLPPEIEASANMSYFFGRITAVGLADLWIFVIWSMRDALEKELADGESATAGMKYAAGVADVAGWVFALGKQLYEKEQDLTPQRQNMGNPGKGGPLWTGKAEFSKGRWTLWKNRLEEIGHRDDIDKETKKLAEEVVEAMNRCEA